MANPRWCLAVLLALVATLLVAPGASARADRGAQPRKAPRTTRVVVITLDGFGTYALRRLGPDRAPVLHRMLDRGAGTLDARTEREMTATLPNHTGMVTGRRIEADHGGHGVFWNDERLEPATVQEAAGHRVASMFSVVRADGGRPALFTSKPKLSLLDRSWPQGIARFVLEPNNDTLARMTRRDLRHRGRALTMLHLSWPDGAGHEHGFSSKAYLEACEHADQLVGTVLRTIRSKRSLRRHTAVVVTADHGGRGDGHDDPTKLANYRIPFVAWGAGVADGADLYDLNPDYRDPDHRRTRYQAARQPVRNGDVANVVVRLLGLDPVPGSRFGRDAALDLR
ncbi:hypothetical protein GCM10009623_07710 [Nocardioides aestuarii]|uniref:Alkaline phosphatase family protein n=1 Tax=Nocardioides aestuarii TaxID=252231 RepID=A0ABW4TI34_9ACTN